LRYWLERVRSSQLAKRVANAVDHDRPELIQELHTPDACRGAGRVQPSRAAGSREAGADRGAVSGYEPTMEV
jgi:hypothetical protein